MDNFYSFLSSLFQAHKADHGRQDHGLAPKSGHTQGTEGTKNKGQAGHNVSVLRKLLLLYPDRVVTVLAGVQPVLGNVPVAACYMGRFGAIQSSVHGTN